MHDRSHRGDPARIAPLDFSPKASPSPETSRRRFLFALGATGAGAAAVGATALAAASAPNIAAVDSGVSRGYQETDHVRNYYVTARL